ncbi:MAG: PAS domain-containing protein [Actinomycetota bacterium]
MEARAQKNLVLILARDLASKLATPMFIADAEGNLVFYNEPAELILGRKYSERYEVSPEDWTKLLEPTDLEGNSLKLDEVPPGIALVHHRPSHAQVRITGLDRIPRTVSVTAFPLLARAQEFVGMLAIFWEDGEPG